MPEITLKKNYDVIIAGGGLAGQTLALQLLIETPELSLLIVDRDLGKAPAAIHRIGESTSELGSYYLHNVLGLKGLLEEKHIRKFGFRFFFHNPESSQLNDRLELGSSIDRPFPAYQIDRGLFENDLLEILRSKGAEIYGDDLIHDIVLGKKSHRITFYESEQEITCTWFVDATGRKGLLKNKLQLGKPIEHDINAVWFRLNKRIDVDEWSDDPKWRNSVLPNMRWRSTNHLMGKGYWMWLIPLVNDNMSIGIVSDPRIHDPKKLNTIEKAFEWIKEHEKSAYDNITSLNPEILDFKHIEHFSYGCEQFISNDGWAITGDAGTFLDPLYSPGGDFIAMNNTWITDVITRDLNQEDTHVRSLTYNFVNEQLINGWLQIYMNKYPLFGNAQTTLFKIVWDWATYWSFPCLIFLNSGYTDMDFLKSYASSSIALGARFAALNIKMQELFEQYHSSNNPNTSVGFINTFDLSFLKEFHLALAKPITIPELIEKLKHNLDILEQVSAAMSAKMNMNEEAEIKVISPQIHEDIERIWVSN